MTWKIALYDAKIFWDKSDGSELKLEVIKEIDFEPNIEDILFFNGTHYRWAARSIENKVFAVEPLEKFDAEPEETYEEEWECPYCSTINHDIFEVAEDDVIMRCMMCYSKVECKREVTMDYIVKLMRASKVIKL